MKKTTFVFIRHAESKKNLRDITGGSGEELTERGIKQVYDFSARLITQIKVENCTIISSNTIQAKQTAKIISNVIGLPLLVTEELKPADMGIVSGLTKQEIHDKFPIIDAQLSLWRNREIEACELSIPGMESPNVFWIRILNYLKSICTGGTKIVVCTRSVLVLIYNYINNNAPTVGNGYKHINIGNCESIAFILDEVGMPIELIDELTSDKLK